MKYTQKTVNIVLRAISKGLSQKDAAALAGISEDTLSRWKKEKVDFADKIRQKEITFKQKNIDVIRKTGEDKSWQAAAWLLERKYPEEFSLKQELRVTTESQDEEISRVLDELERENEEEAFARECERQYQQLSAK